MEDDVQVADPPYTHCIVAGTIGGSTGDLIMHSLDTVKTRQQGAPLVPKYVNMGSAYRSIFHEEGLLRGLYAGVTPAILGSIPATAIFFGTYEFSKRTLVDMGMNDTVAPLLAGFVGDFFASAIYVPSEVLKTRLQLQGRYANPHFQSGYNYRGTVDAARTIYKTEGASALFHGYRATICRDLPFSALTFFFYEMFKRRAREYKGEQDMGLIFETLSGAAAGALAGALTTPLDVIKTRIQTQHPDAVPLIKPATDLPHGRPGTSNTMSSKPGHATTSRNTLNFQAAHQMRQISTTSPSTSTPIPSTYTLTTSNPLRGLGQIVQHEGLVGLFRGIGPRTAWTAAQSSIMLVVYENMLKGFAGLESELVPAE
ncbi:protein of unknown function [Taphrina deformans PYCC 5710]|uniref:Mitochondrial carrier protein n=1 Tax=Taphrina deformans (strain PYCC 5710 / ATCC 11124 / CBS 356.35 / IMI 108563 / JCM 9778 / NBRC 8474) TaxID=1097556 RepID=R4XKX4_TAPDE|nr:protein of unknown function [Taphrina deformans PYCC 5710]|eukprot:CCG83964.1 protein of unknown function [Taphrina deformans PYCC 5710]